MTSDDPRPTWRSGLHLGGVVRQQSFMPEDSADLSSFCMFLQDVCLEFYHFYQGTPSPCVRCVRHCAPNMCICTSEDPRRQVGGWLPKTKVVTCSTCSFLFWLWFAPSKPVHQNHFYFSFAVEWRDTSCLSKVKRKRRGWLWVFWRCAAAASLNKKSPTGPIAHYAEPGAVRIFSHLMKCFMIHRFDQLHIEAQVHAHTYYESQPGRLASCCLRT